MSLTTATSRSSNSTCTGIIPTFASKRGSLVKLVVPSCHQPFQAKMVAPLHQQLHQPPLSSTTTGITTSRLTATVPPSVMIPMQPNNKKRKVSIVTSDLPVRLLDPKKVKHCQNPQDFLMSHLQSKGIAVQTHTFNSISEFFEEPKVHEIEAYGFEALGAVRNRDFDKLRQFHKEGRPLKCSNRFGESLLHLACRKGFADVTEFLVNEAHVPVQIKDDFGRNPVHDACWTCVPNFELMDVLLDACPDLLYISDARGHVPLNYARRQHWAEWIDYLKQRGDTLKPRVLLTSAAVGTIN